MLKIPTASACANGRQVRIPYGDRVFRRCVISMLILGAIIVQKPDEKVLRQQKTAELKQKGSGACLLKRIKKLEELALIDEEVGIYNSKYFSQRLNEEVERARRHSLFLSLVMLNIAFSEKEGLALTAGNGSASPEKSELRELGAFTQRQLRCTDIIALASGDIVGIILPETVDDGALKAAERLCSEIESYNFTGREKCNEATSRFIKVSMGVSCFPIHATTSTDLIGTARSMLRQAQKNPTSSIKLFSEQNSVSGRMNNG